MKTHRERPGTKRRWRSGRAAASILVLIWSTAAALGTPPAGISSSITTNYYVFGGTNAAQMRASMLEARPWKQTMAYDAETRWHIRSSYLFTQTNGEYRLSAVKVRSTVEITLPMWVPDKPVARELVVRWQKCLADLVVHEHGHLQLGQAAAAELNRRLGELAGFDSTQELDEAADKALRETLEKFRHRERLYDRVTRHGRTQGAIFPVESDPEEAVTSSATPAGGSPRYRNIRSR